MPIYLGQEVSDDYLQGLIGAYRDGQREGGGNVEDGDQVVIDRLSEEKVVTQVGAKELGTFDVSDHP
jgi:hypothetical protein